MKLWRVADCDNLPVIQHVYYSQAYWRLSRLAGKRKKKFRTEAALLPGKGVCLLRREEKDFEDADRAVFGEWCLHIGNRRRPDLVVERVS